MAQAGNKEAFGCLISRYQPFTRRLAAKHISETETARELAHEAMLEAYLSLSRLRDPSRFQSWLYGITLNVCRNYLREQEKQRRLYTLLPSDTILDQPDPQTLVEERERQDWVREALKTLSPDNQAAVQLFYYQQQSLQETAATLSISVAAVKSRLHKARKLLRGPLSAFNPDPAISLTRKSRRTPMVPVQVVGVYQYHKADQAIQATVPFVLLKDAEGHQVRIWIGEAEAKSILQGLENIPRVRPMTMDFLLNLLNVTGAVLDEVRVETLKDETFYAVVKLRVGSKFRELDARPSDAIALAVHAGRPLLVAEEIIATAGAENQEVDEQSQKMTLVSLSAIKDATELAHDLIRQAIQENPDEITIGSQPGTAMVQVLYRFAEVVSEKMTVPKKDSGLLIEQFKRMADLDIRRTGEPQEGEIPIRWESNEYRLHVKVRPDDGDERLEMSFVK